jgi:hypothetical protein
MIEFFFFGYAVNIQFIPIYGCGLGVLYYNPNLQPDEEDVPEDDFYHQVTVMFLFFGIHLTIWKYY